MLVLETIKTECFLHSSVTSSVVNASTVSSEAYTKAIQHFSSAPYEGLSAFVQVFSCESKNWAGYPPIILILSQAQKMELQTGTEMWFV